ncbi:MAG: hypothetical protein RIQ72_693 [Candidatus Parcubacteria bacterium]|jgi:hypothetical protein
MKFFYILTKSISSKQFYGEVIGGKHPTGFMFLAKVQVLVALFMTILVSIQISSVLPTLEQKMASVLPEGAEIILKEGRLQSNTNPITVPLSQGKEIGDGTSAASIPNNLFVIDVTASTTEEEFHTKNTFMLITSEGIVYGESGKKISTNYFTEIKDVDMVIDKQFLTDKAKTIKEYAKFLPFILFIVLLIVLYVMALFTAFMYAVFVFIMFKVMKIGKGFKEAFAVAMYSRGFALILGVFALILPLLMIPTLSILVQILFITLMIRPARLKNII